ncbi:MAG: O-fucosyltransferase family protein [Pseudomonadota bacterium]
MRQLFYTNYQSGQAGLSNAIMSIECGVVLAFLTKRFLLLDGNVSPPANIVDYDGRVDNSRPSRITDLIDIPIPWGEPDLSELAGLASTELTPYSLMDVAIYVPDTVDIHSPDAQDFAGRRHHWVCESHDMRDVPVLRVSEHETVPGTDRQRNNLSYYSYLFYLDAENRRAVYELLSKMQAQRPYADLAKRVATDLGAFNAVHMRRGDFKVTYGVTVLDRQPWEAIETMDHHFSRDDRLLICTDERDDPFFAEIRESWPDHVFIDHHILENYAAEFAALPQHDSLALAYLSQLVAAESSDFIGSMTSTFSAMIQRLRGNRGKQENFKFFWNELPDPGEKLERGRHPISECVPMDRGLMIEEFSGAYSWNRYSQLLNPAWMREWPESFLLPDILASGILPSPQRLDPAASGGSLPVQAAQVLFEGLRFRISSRVAGIANRLQELLYDSRADDGGSVVEEIEISGYRGAFSVIARGEVIATVKEESELPAAILDHVVRQLSANRKNFSWFDGMALKSGNTVLLILGDWTAEDLDISMAEAMCSKGWQLLGDTAVPIRMNDLSVVPFSRCGGGEQQRPLDNFDSPALSAIVYSSRQLHNRSALFSLSPSAAVAEMTGASRDFPLDRKATIKRLCKLAEQLPAYQLCFSDAAQVPDTLAALTTTLAKQEER